MVALSSSVAALLRARKLAKVRWVFNQFGASQKQFTLEERVICHRLQNQTTSPEPPEQNAQNLLRKILLQLGFVTGVDLILTKR
jgi:hypothetical protein